MSVRPHDPATRFDTAEFVAIADRLAQRRDIDAGAYIGTVSDDVIKGTRGADTIDVSQGGDDKVLASGGDDTIYFGAAYTGADTVRGQKGFDTLIFDGDYSAGLSLTGIQAVEKYVFLGGSYTLAGSVGQVTLDASGLTSDEQFAIDFTSIYRVVAHGGSGDDTIKVITKDEALELSGGDGDDVLIGDSSSDTFSADTEGTIFNGGGGSDEIDMRFYHFKNKVQYDAETDSTRESPDIIRGFNTSEWPDTIRLYFDADKTVGGVQHYFHLGATPGHIGDILTTFKHSETIVQVFTDADTKPDFVIYLEGNVHLNTYNFDFTP